MNPNTKTETLFNYELGIPYETIVEASQKIKLKISSLCREMIDQKEHVERVKKETEDLRMRLIGQSLFCVNVGACLGHILWKALNHQEAVQYLVPSQRLEHFFRLASGILVSFSSTYKNEMPDVGCNEMQFILSICGIIVNIASISKGARQIVTDEHGKDLIKHIINILLSTPFDKKGNPLKRSLLIILHNISTIRSGLRFIQTSEDLLKALSGVLNRKKSDELTILSLRLIESLSYDVPSVKYMKQIMKTINPTQISAYQNEADRNLKSCAENIIQNLTEATQKFDQAEYIKTELTI